MTTIRVKKPGNNSYLNYRPELCWCGQLKNTTHVCTDGLPKTEIYELKDTVINV